MRKEFLVVVGGVEYMVLRDFDGKFIIPDLFRGIGTALKPAHEPICVARKPLSESTVAANVIKFGTGALNIDTCRVEVEVGGRPLLEVAPLRDDIQYSGNVLAGRVDGSLASSKAVGFTDIGRWPANFIHDGSEEVVELFPVTKSGAMKTEVPSYDGDGVTGFLRGHSGPSNQHGDSGSAARFFYCAKTSKKDRGDGNAHPTVKPTDLMRYLVRLVTPPNGTVFDPFLGSGSTGKAAMMESFNFIGIEMSEDYFNISKSRIESVMSNSEFESDFVNKNKEIPIIKLEYDSSLAEFF